MTDERKCVECGSTDEDELNDDDVCAPCGYESLLDRMYGSDTPTLRERESLSEHDRRL